MTVDYEHLLGGNPPPATADQLAGVIGVSARTVRELAQQGIIQKTERGKYDLRESVRGYCHHLRETAARRNPNGGDLTAERTRLAAAQADRAELEVATRRGELIPLDEVRLEWATIAVDVRSALLAVPGRLALDTETTGKLDAELRRAMESLDHGDS